jgi:hypothetical protein
VNTRSFYFDGKWEKLFGGNTRILSRVWVTIGGFGLVNGFIQFLQLINTSNDYAVTVPHTSQITIGHTRPSQPVTVFTSRCLVVAFDGELYPFSVFPDRPWSQLTHSHSDWTPAVLQLTHSLTNKLFTALTVKVKVTLRLTASQSVSQSVMVWSHIWGSWPGISYCLTVTVLSLWGALSDERTGPSFVRVIVCSNKSLAIMQNIFTILHVIRGNKFIYNMYRTSVSPGSVQQIN